MAAVTMAAVKELRERLGAGMMDSKKALEEANGDIEKAIEILRLQGAKGVAKREGRATTEGLVAVSENEGSATLIELACETDFVAKNAKFVELGEKVLAAVVAAGAEDLESALAADADGQTVAELINDDAAIIGEKLELRRVAVVKGDKVAVYMHRTSKDLPPQVGVVVAYSGSDDETARAIAQHISFADPVYLSREDVPAEEVKKEEEIVTEIAKGEGKPEAALPKIIEGRLTGFFKNIALLEQPYARDNKLSVQQVVDQAGITIQGFARLKVGA
ncbi:translation elongation factor Ts [Canibacter zhoujuaniae]|uniref:translation elongation factor Ts n=1 Tax=Canibacter zhoujuaniae TaxID=2708343 RepID=UPI001423D7EF|nr:translation elongation factor Ts [Canibacter zhoujuaniae]